MIINIHLIHHLKLSKALHIPLVKFQQIYKTSSNKNKKMIILDKLIQDQSLQIIQVLILTKMNLEERTDLMVQSIKSTSQRSNRPLNMQELKRSIFENQNQINSIFHSKLI